MAERSVYLGRVNDLRTKLGSTPLYRYAQVQPLWQSDDAGTTWEGRIREPLKTFPLRGFVFWHNAPPAAERGSVWQFGVTEHPDADSDRRKERFQVEDPNPAIEIVDLRQIDSTAIRSALTAAGCLLNPEPIAHKVLLWLAEGRLVGPVSLERATDTRRWVLAGADSSQLDSWRTPSTSIDKVIIDNVPRLFLAPPLELGASRGLENWSSDVEVMKGVLRRLRKLDRGAADALKVTEQVFRDYVSAIDRSGLLEKDLLLDRARGERVTEILKRIGADHDFLRSASDALFDSERVQLELAAKVKSAFEAQLASAQAAIDAALSPSQRQLADLEAAIQTRQKTLDKLGAEVATRERELADKVAGFDLAMTEQLRKVAERPHEAFAELAWARAVLSPPPRAAWATRIEPDTAAAATPVSTLSSQEQFRTAFAKAFVSRGLDPLAGIDLHATFLTGGLPFVFGQAVQEVLDAYASVVCGGRALWIPVGGTVLEPQDLLARLDITSRRLVPHPGGLLNLIVQARESDRMWLCILDGANRAAMESYLLPFLESAASQQGQRNAREIPIVSADVLASDDPWSGCTRVLWPRNLLIAAVPTNGVSVLPASDDIMCRSTLIHAMRPPALLKTDETGTEVMSVVTPAAWQAWQTEAARAESTAIGKAFAEMRQRAGLPGERLDLARRVCGALVSCGLQEKDSLRRSLTIAAAHLPAETIAALGPTLHDLQLDADAAWRFNLDVARRLAD